MNRYEYIGYLTASLLTAFAGAQVVHKIYNPMKNYAEMVEEEKVRIRKIIAEQKESSKSD